MGTGIDCVTRITSHFDWFLKDGLADSGSAACQMWRSSMETIADGAVRKEVQVPSLPQTHYRSIMAPGGCTLYYDQPLLVAAYDLSAYTGKRCYAEAADNYVADFLQRCVARNGIFLWGNHYYWHAGLGQTVKFVGEEQPYPVQLAEETGDYHEVRPIPPAWEIFWKLSAGAAEKEIRTFVTNSLFDQQGGFNRHADGKKGCAFLESGGIMVVSLAYLYRRIKNPALLELADKIVDFSFSHRHEKTGLLENNPTQTRWDKFVSTTEIGLWASCLLKAVELTGRQKWLDKARAAVRAYLSYGYEEATGKYLGQLLVDTGTSPFVTPCSKIAGNAIYQPGRYSEPWRQFFPSHDYPLQMAETCLELYRLTGEEIFRVACQRWAEQMMKDYQECRQQGRVFYAERYGRCLHFLWRCSQVLGEKEYLQKASFLAEEALASLWQGRMFRSHTGEDRYQAVDGLGYLFLSLLCLELNEEVEMMGTFW